MDMIEGHAAVPPREGVPVWDVDPYDDNVLTDPAPYYEELRRQGPFAYIPKFAMLACGRYAETKEVFSDWKRFVSSRGVAISDHFAGIPSLAAGRGRRRFTAIAPQVQQSRRRSAVCSK
jgi:hypothetical protein